MLEIKNLHASVEGSPILKGLNLKIGEGEVHAIMGPNGSGKSTLANVIAGRDTYEITQGSILYKGQELLDMSIEDRARAGVFLAFQYPIEIPGVSNSNFLKVALNAAREARGEGPLDAFDFQSLLQEKTKYMDFDPSFLSRGLNEGFSGGEKKRNEIFQMAVLEPSFAVLDETDSGLDIDALKTVSNGINALRSSNRSFLLITHYQRLLNYVQPDYVHVLAGGQIVQSGDKSLALELEDKGYGWVQEQQQGSV